MTGRGVPPERSSGAGLRPAGRCPVEQRRPHGPEPSPQRRAQRNERGHCGVTASVGSSPLPDGVSCRGRADPRQRPYRSTPGAAQEPSSTIEPDPLRSCLCRAASESHWVLSGAADAVSGALPPAASVIRQSPRHRRQRPVRTGPDGTTPGIPSKESPGPPPRVPGSPRLRSSRNTRVPPGRHPMAQLPSADDPEPSCRFPAGPLYVPVRPGPLGCARRGSSAPRPASAPPSPSPPGAD